MTFRKMLLASTVSFIAARAFDNTAGWKKDADGHLVLQDGNPVWIDANGGEKALRADAISQANSEAKQHRVRAEAAEASLQKYSIDGKLIDPELAVKSVDLASKIDAKTLIDAGKVDEVKKQITDQFGATITELQGKLNAATSELDNKYIETDVFGSDFMDKIAMPKDFFTAAMRSNFKREEGKIAAYDRSGNRIMSAKNIGEYASPTEALEILVNQHPQKDTILKAPDASGSGNGGGGGARGTGRTVSRADFMKLPANQQAELAGKAGKGEVTITD